MCVCGGGGEWLYQVRMFYNIVVFPTAGKRGNILSTTSVSIKRTVDDDVLCLFVEATLKAIKGKVKGFP